MRKKQKACFEFNDSSLVGGGTLLTGKSDFHQENNIAYFFRIEQWKNVCMLFQSVITYFYILQWFPSSLFVIRSKGLSNAETHIVFRIICNCCFYQLSYYWFSFSISYKIQLFYFVLENPSWFEPFLWLYL